MYTDSRRLPRELKDWLQRWEDDHGIPVRVLNGSWRAGHEQPINNWTDTQARACDTTRQRASANGLTIVHMAAHVNNAWIDYGRRVPEPPAREGIGLNFTDFFTALAPGVEDPTGRHGGRVYVFGDYTPITWSSPDGDQVYGEVGERVVFYYWNLETCSSGYYDYDHLFASLEDAIDPEAAERRREEMIRNSFTNFMEFMSEGRINSQVNSLRQQIAGHEVNISSWQNSLAHAIAQASGMRTQIEAMLDAAGRSEEEWRTQYEAIVNNPAVESVIFQANSLRVITGHIRLQGRGGWEGESRWLGRFRIDVNLTNYAIHIHNMDNPQQGRDHPHVPGGAPCFGGNASEFTNLIGNGQFAIFFELIIQWLETYNPNDDWGQYARYWFDLEDRDPRFHEDDETATTEQDQTEATEAAVPVAVGVTTDLDEDIFAEDYDDDEDY